MKNVCVQSQEISYVKSLFSKKKIFNQNIFWQVECSFKNLVGTFSLKNQKFVTAIHKKTLASIFFMENKSSQNVSRTSRRLISLALRTYSGQPPTKSWSESEKCSNLQIISRMILHKRSSEVVKSSFESTAENTFSIYEKIWHQNQKIIDVNN